MSIITLPSRARGAAVGGIALGAIAMSSAAMADAAVADLVERVSPAVVTVYTTQDVDLSQSDNPFGFPEGSPFEEFFKRFGFPEGMPGQPMPHEGPRQALGSGFIIDSGGYVITNNHVVDDADEVKVRLNNQHEYEAEVVGTDEQTDIALLKIKADETLPHLTLGNSDDIRVGDDVIAVGNPFGLGGSVTKGIVSATGRDINAGPYVDFIQTDAAINHGNSGGPLFDMSGNVIGVNSSIYSPNGGSVGVGFAIPSNIVKNVVAQLKEDGSVERGWLGVAIQTVTPDIASAMGVNKAEGALVANVVEGSPSDGKLQVGDLITSFNGKNVATSRDLPALVAAVEPGTTVDVGIVRDGKQETIGVKIGELDAEQLATNRAAPTGDEGKSSNKLGATVAALTPDTREQLGLDDSVEGAVITSLKSGGAASEAGLQVGDVIVRVGDTKVKDAHELESALEGSRNETALLLVNRHGDQVFMSVKMAA